MKPVGHRVGLLLGMVTLVGSGCKPLSNGQSSAHPTPVSNQQIVLVKRGNERGAIVFAEQSLNPEHGVFHWYYRADGRGTFSEGDPAVTRGVVTNGKSINFATFSINWSGNREGAGWVYHSRGPTEFSKTPDYSLCVTDQTNLATLDANDRRWKFRSRPPINFRELVRSQTGL